MRALLVALALLLIAPAGSFAAPEASPGIRLQTSISERGVVSARAVGRHLYVSSLTGVSIFDISNPRAPVRVGRLDLPNAQNEDVDAGSGILLVSDDPVGGRGILHVIDVRDPANPLPLSTYSTWRPGFRGIGHTATCIQECRYAWLAGSPAGIDIIDLRDPARPRLARRFPAREAAARGLGTHDVQVDSSGLAWVAGARGTAAYDVTDPVRPRLVMRTDRRGARKPWNNFIHHNSLRLRRNVVAITEEHFRDQCKRAGSLQTWRIRGRVLRPLDSFGVERDGASRVMCSAHYFDARDGLIAQGFYEQGVRLIDARRPGRLRQVGYFISRPGLVWGALFAPTDPTGSTLYSIDHSRGIDVLAIDRDRLRPVRRRGARRPAPDPGSEFTDVGFAMVVDSDGETMRPGRATGIGFAVIGRGGPVRVEATLPPALVDVRPPRGATYDAATRTLRYTVRRVSDVAGAILRARVAPDAAAGTPIEVIAYARGPGDPLPLDDRGVFRTAVGAPATSGLAVAARQPLCRLPAF
jgi:LVIVD repeat